MKIDFFFFRIFLLRYNVTVVVVNNHAHVEHASMFEHTLTRIRIRPDVKYLFGIENRPLKSVQNVFLFYYNMITTTFTE